MLASHFPELPSGAPPESSPLEVTAVSTLLVPAGVLILRKTVP